MVLNIDHKSNNTPEDSSSTSLFIYTLNTVVLRALISKYVYMVQIIVK